MSESIYLYAFFVSLTLFACVSGWVLACPISCLRRFLCLNICVCMRFFLSLTLFACVLACPSVFHCRFVCLNLYVCMCFVFISLYV
jgi:hypothetical protein